MRPSLILSTTTLLLTLLSASLTHAQLTPELILSTGIPHNTPHISLSPDGKTTLTTQFDGTATFLETATGRTLNSLDLEHGRYTSPYIPIFASNDTVYFLSDKRVRRFDIPSFSFTRDLNISQPTAYARDPASGIYYIAGQRGERATLWTLDPSNNRVRPFHNFPQTTYDPVQSITLAPREKLALLTYKSGTADLLRTGPRWAVAKTYPASKDKRVLLPDGRILTAPDGFTTSFALSNPANAATPLTISLPGSQPITQVLPPHSPTAPILIATYSTLFQLDPKNNQLTVLRTFLQNDGVNQAQINTIAVTPDHRTLFAHIKTTFHYSDSYIISPASSKFTRWEPTSFLPTKIWASKTNRILALEDGDGRFKRIDINTSGLTITSSQKRPKIQTTPPTDKQTPKIVSTPKNDQTQSTIGVVDRQTGKTLWQRTAHVQWYRSNEKDNTLIFLTTPYYVSRTAQGEHRHTRYILNIVDIQTGKNILEPLRIASSADWPDFIAATHDGQSWVIQEDKTLRIYNLSNLAQPKEIKLSRRLAKGDLLAGEKHLAAIAGRNIALFDLEAAQHLGDLTLMPIDTHWAFVTPDGLFDAPIEAQPALNFAFGITPAPLTSFHEPFFRPRLIDDLLASRTVAPSIIDLTQLAQPPSTRATLINNATKNILNLDTTEESDVILNVAIASGTTPLRELRVFHNGKRLNLATRGLFVEDDEPASPSYNHNRQIPLRLLPGKNTLSVVAINAQNIESEATELRVTLKAAPNQTLPTLHLLAVGIDQYQNEKYNLNYAVADSTAFAETIQANSQNLFSTINYQSVKNNNAIKQNLLASLDKIRQTAQPSDVFIFYYAGHGVVAQQGSGDFYIVPHNVTQLYGDDDQLQIRALSSNQLQDISSQISAQKQLFILDACQSAGALTGLKQRGAAEERAIAQLARSTGTHWLTASGSQQYATEFATLGHGAFTYTLLQALDGAADTGDGSVTVNELKAFLESQVPEVTAQHKGTAQYPASYGYGQDFPITIN